MRSVNTADDIQHNTSRVFFVSNIQVRFTTQLTNTRCTCKNSTDSPSQTTSTTLTSLNTTAWPTDKSTRHPPEWINSAFGRVKCRTGRVNISGSINSLFHHVVNYAFTISVTSMDYCVLLDVINMSELAAIYARVQTQVFNEIFLDCQKNVILLKGLSYIYIIYFNIYTTLNELNLNLKFVIEKVSLISGK